MGDRPELTLTWQGGREETVVAGDGQTVLEAAEAVGVSLPFGCRTGACATCTGLTASGRLSYTRPPRALEPRHREAGYVLCCIAIPRIDCRIAVGTAVRDELISNPWK